MSRLVLLLLCACGPDLDKNWPIEEGIPGSGDSATDDSATDDSATDDSATDDSATDDTSAPGPNTTCADLGLPAIPWQDAEDSALLGALAADLTLETDTGPWTLSEQWSGCEVYLFIPSNPSQATGFDKALWERAADTEDLIDALPKNAQLFFVASERSEETRAESLAALKEDIDAALADMDAEDAAWWTPRIHYLQGRDSEQPGWLGETLNNPGWGAHIDRFQRVRYIGSFADPRRYDDSVGWFEPNISFAAYEVVADNLQATWQAQLDADGAEVVRVFDGDTCSGSVSADITLPDAETLQSYDTMTVDLTMACVGDGEYGDCPAWDYMAYLYLCDQAAEDNPYAETPCTPGTDTQTGACVSPTGAATTGTYSCNAEGTGYDALSCACNTELGRWITTYHREGRWVYDNSAALPLVSKGGAQRLRFETSGPYELTLDLRFTATAKEARPQETFHLYGEGWIYEGSNALVEPVTVAIPAEATKVELATVISGHGSDANYCGEFCNMEHHFVVNDGYEVLWDSPTAGTQWGCRNQVEDGAIPNQYGTWWYGRAGWCPGMQVPTVVTDITDQVVIGADNTFDYYATFDGAEYTGSSYNRMNAWVVVSY